MWGLAQVFIFPCKMADLYFENDDPLGKPISMRLRDGSHNFNVTAVIEVPDNSSLRFDFLISYKLMGEATINWGSNNVYTFPYRKYN